MIFKKYISNKIESEFQKNVLHFLNVSFIKRKRTFVIFMRPSVTCEDI